MVFHRPSGHLFLGSLGRCPWDWLPALAVTLSDCSHHCPVPLHKCAEPLYCLLTGAVCLSRRGDPPILLQPFRGSTPLEASRPVNVATTSQCELRAEQAREPEGFLLPTLLLENVHILKYMYVPYFSCWVIFFPYILRVRFWVILMFDFVSLLLWFFIFLFLFLFVFRQSSILFLLFIGL